VTTPTTKDECPVKKTKIVECMKYNHHCCPKVGNMDRHWVPGFITALIVIIILALVGALVVIIMCIRNKKKNDDTRMLMDQADFGYSTADTWGANDSRLLDYDHGGDSTPTKYP